MYVNEPHDIVKFLHTPMVPKKQLAFYDESSYHTNSIFSTSIRPNVVCAFVVEFILSFYNGSPSASIIWTCLGGLVIAICICHTF